MYLREMVISTSYSDYCELLIAVTNFPFHLKFFIIIIFMLLLVFTNTVKSFRLLEKSNGYILKFYYLSIVHCLFRIIMINYDVRENIISINSGMYQNIFSIHLILIKPLKLFLSSFTVVSPKLTNKFQ